ncbi:MAG: AAA family ATPase [Desulfuromonadaceae bacterium]|nr:AAA family ATPase [Desulfuromonadaceae bacterium]
MNIQAEINDWLHGRHDWLQEAATRILKNGNLNTVDFDDLTALCKTEAGQKKTKNRIFPGLTSKSAVTNELRLVSIGDINGIENLAPRKPLVFGSGNLTVIYGNNGSGKSGYTRILKKACGKAHAVDLRPNVFESTPSKCSCTIRFKLGGTTQSQEWETKDEAILELAPVDIFDTECGKFYLGKENEASYIPDSVALFDLLVKACEGVKQRLQTEINNLPSKLPSIPANFAGTDTTKAYLNLKPTQTEADLVALLLWTDADKQALLNLEERLKTDDQAKLAIQKRAQKVQLDAIINKLMAAIGKLSVEACKHVHNLKRSAVDKRTIAVEGAKTVLASASLAGIGSQTWRALWEAARQYSSIEAYQEYDFPFTEDGSKCVLCQQKLEAPVQKRLRDFEGYVKGEIEKAAKVAENARDEVINALPKIPKMDEVDTACQAAGLETDLWLSRLSEAWKAIEQLVEELKSSSENVPAGIFPQNYPWLKDLLSRSKALEEQATQHDADALTFDRAKANKQRDELLAKLWTSQQSEAIKAELRRLNQVEKISEWMSSTNQIAISKQAGIIAEKMITDAYIERFNNELKLLGAKRIKVELVKTRTTKGRAMHGIRLKGLKSNGITPPEVLSEGERRIVELAAFLADVTGKTDDAPFIFDDPISSLDQDFEEKTIDRLIMLSATRQVLIFTHRLSFLGILNDKASPDIVCIRHEPWGTGEPGEVPLFGKNPEGVLKVLRDERLKQAEKVLKQDGSEAYYPLAKGICSDFRILIERIVELVFLADVIQRHRREVHTKNKIGKLAKITSDDCLLVDEFMGKYSCYEHSQSAEAPVDVPPPNDLYDDINKLLTWHGEFKGRA